MVIRQGANVKTARYHEVSGYTFLLNSMKPPRLLRMDSGRLMLSATSWIYHTGEEVGIAMTSDNAGMSSVSWLNHKTTEQEVCGR